jgi:DNA-binding protein HU-beta
VKTVLKADLINSISERASISKKDVEKVLNAFLESVTDTLIGGDTVKIVNFGEFALEGCADESARGFQATKKTGVPVSSIPVSKATVSSVLASKVPVSSVTASKASAAGVPVFRADDAWIATFNK